MRKFDHHIHSYKSFDADRRATIGEILRVSELRGLGQIALCDHYDVNFIAAGENPDIDFNETAREISAARELNPCATEFLLGIELGQPNQLPELADKVLAGADFDFVLCSLHNTRGEPDFYYLDYKNTGILRLIDIFEHYTEELCELANWGSFHALAHVTYPVRYFFLNNIHISIRKYTDIYRRLFGIIIGRGIALEVNTSGLRKKINEPSPSFELLKLYKSMGGELITVGSDAHNPIDIGSGIDYTYEKLRQLGFRYICEIKEKKLHPVLL